MRALIVGIDGMIGRALGEALTARGDAVFGTTRRAGTADREHRFQLDLATPDAGDASLPAVDMAIFCAAKARYAECRADPALARRVNVENTLALARRLAAGGSRVLLLSTSAVFDGSLPHRRAEEFPKTASLYGRLKGEAEAGFMALGRAASILRLTKIVTPQLPLFAEWIAALAAGQAIRAFADLRFCPLGLDDVVGALLAAIDDGGEGIYQVSGAADIVYADAARHLARRLGARLSLVEDARAIDHGIPPEEILAHTSLDTARLSVLTGFRPPDPHAVLDRVVVSTRPAELAPAG